MASDGAGVKAGTADVTRRTAEQSTALRQAVKDCYCGLGTACPHWHEMTPEGRVDCARDKRAVVDSLWKNGTVT
jgi:hypothetical protein